MGALIREALEKLYAESEKEERLQAIRELSALQLPVADWEEMERESKLLPKESWLQSLMRRWCKSCSIAIRPWGNGSVRLRSVASF